MRKFLFLLLMIVSVNTWAQEPYKVYCELLGTGKLLSNKVTVIIDFGQETSFWNGASNQYLVDDKGKKIKFNSMVDAMNYMGKRGWKFEQAYVVTTSNQNVYHWLLSNEVTEVEAINKDFNTKQAFEEKLQIEDSEKEEAGENEISKKKNDKKRSRATKDDIYN